MFFQIIIDAIQIINFYKKIKIEKFLCTPDMCA